MSEANTPPESNHDSSQASNAAPQAEPTAATAPAKPRSYDKIPRQFGRYRIQECLGKGGMGVVFKALDLQLNRPVALKIPFLDGDDHEELRQRFYREARAAATLHHANICPVFDVGENNGVPYLTMAFIDGKSLLKTIHADPPFPAVRIGVLTRKLALAMQDAHDHGVVHRDLKPANVILRPNGEPVIMDFGLARRADDTRGEGLTRPGDILGTVEYMSPEQVDGDNAALGPCTDIYSLGVIMYEMMCARRPFDGSTAAMLAAIMTKDPPKPTDMRPDLPPKLEEICLKAMSKKPEDRFSSMAQFAAALADFLRTYKPGQPVAATQKIEKPAAEFKSPAAATRPISQFDIDTDDGRRKTPSKESVRPKSAELKSGARRPHSGRRKKTKSSPLVPILVGGGIALVFIAAAVAALVIFWPRGENQTAQASSNLGTTQTSQRPAPAPHYTPRATRATQRNVRPSPAAPPRPVGFTLKVSPEPLTLEVGQSKQFTLSVERKEFHGPIRVNIRAPREVRVTPGTRLTLNPDQSDATLTAFMTAIPSAGARMEISAYAENNSQFPVVSSRLEVNAAANGDCLRIVELNADPKFIVDSATFTPDLSHALIAAGNTIHIWDLARGSAAGKLDGHRDRITGLSVSADGSLALSTSADRTVILWDLAIRKLRKQSVDVKKRVLGAAMSPDGHRGIVIYLGSIVRVNLDTFQPILPAILVSHLMGSNAEDAIQTVAISSEKKALLGGNDGKLLLLDFPDKGKMAAPKALPGHADTVVCSSFARDGQLAATGSKDKTVHVWDVAARVLKWKSDGMSDAIVSVRFSPDGSMLATGESGGGIHVWNAADGKLIAKFSGQTNPILALAFAPDGKSLWSASTDKTLRQWRLP